MKPTRLLVALLTVILVATAACTTVPPSSAPSTEVTQPTVGIQATTAASPDAATAPGQTAALGATVPVQSTATAGLPAPKSGALQNYVAQMEYKQEEVKPEQSVQTWVSMTVQFQGQPAPGLYHLNVVDKIGEQTKPGSGSMEMIVAGQDSYIMMPQQGDKWLKMSSEESGANAMTSNLLDPNRLAEQTPAALFGPSAVVSRNESIGGVETTHYRLKDTALASALVQEIGTGKLISGQADYWIVNRGGYIKQYALDATIESADGRQVHEIGKLQVNGENSPVAISVPGANQVMAMDVFNQPAQQEPNSTAEPSGASKSPAGQAAIKTIPAPPQGKVATNAQLSAKVREAMPVYTTEGLPSALYVTPAKGDDIFNFYRTEILKLGWTEVMAQSGSTIEQPGMFIFSKGSLSLMMVILPDTAKNNNVVFFQIEG